MEPVTPNKPVAVADMFGFSREVVDLVKTNIAKGASDDELKVFLLTCQRVGLDPFSKQIYLIGRYDKKAGKEIRTPQFSIDGFRSIAAKTNEHAGTDDAKFDDETKDHPNKATVTVYRLIGGQPRAFTATARWEEYAQRFKDDKGVMQLTTFWVKMPYLMLAKCAEALALRKAFPQELAGLYTVDEMGQAANPTDAAPPTPPTDTPTAPISPKPTMKAEVVPSAPSPLDVATPPPEAGMEPIKETTKFEIELFIEAIRPDLDQLRTYMVRRYKTSIVANLTEAQGQDLILVFKTKYPDRIQVEGEASKRGQELPPPPPAPVKPPPPPQTSPAPVPAPQAKRDWMKEARNVQSEQEVEAFIKQMTDAGEPSYKIKAARAIIETRLTNPYHGHSEEK